MVEVNKIIIAKSIEIWGEDAQTTVCMEECAELIQAIFVKTYIITTDIIRLSNKERMS